jgi:hypothetical protein
MVICPLSVLDTAPPLAELGVTRFGTSPTPDRQIATGLADPSTAVRRRRCRVRSWRRFRALKKLGAKPRRGLVGDYLPRDEATFL